jgi:hypothetical protein
MPGAPLPGAGAPPDALQVKLSAAWDLTGGGSFSSPGGAVLFTPTSKGRLNVAFRVLDEQGHTAVARTTVVVG